MCTGIEQKWGVTDPEQFQVFSLIHVQDAPGRFFSALLRKHPADEHVLLFTVLGLMQGLCFAGNEWQRAGLAVSEAPGTFSVPVLRQRLQALHLRCVREGACTVGESQSIARQKPSHGKEGAGRFIFIESWSLCFDRTCSRVGLW